MPIYEYRCSSCGHEQEYLQKLNAAPITDCPECGQSTMVKLMSAAGFQLKGSGWYATDFKNGSKPAAKTGAVAEAKSEGGSDPGKSEGTKPESGSDAVKPAETKTDGGSDSGKSEGTKSKPAPATASGTN